MGYKWGWLLRCIGKACCKQLTTLTPLTTSPVDHFALVIARMAGWGGAASVSPKLFADPYSTNYSTIWVSRT